MSQLDMFDCQSGHPRARNSDPWTSHAAAASLDDDVTARLYRIIIAALKVAAGTQYEIADLTGLDHYQVNKRLPELERLGLAKPTGETRPGPSGRQCRVWAAV